MQYNSVICKVIMRFIRDINPRGFYRRVVWEEVMIYS